MVRAARQGMRVLVLEQGSAAPFNGTLGQIIAIVRAIQCLPWSVFSELR
jgi:hypothetical protein